MCVLGVALRYVGVALMCMLEVALRCVCYLRDKPLQGGSCLEEVPGQEASCLSPSGVVTGQRESTSLSPPDHSQHNAGHPDVNQGLVHPRQVGR